MSRSYCFTYNIPADCIDETDPNFNEGVAQSAYDNISGIPHVRYCVGQLERAPTTDQMHIQGYIELSRPVSFKFLKEQSGLPTLHLESRKGTRAQARKYCMKEESRVAGPWETGKFDDGGQGTRSDLRSMYEAIKSKPSIADVELLENFTNSFLRYPHAVTTIRRITQAQDERKAPEVRLWLGPPRCGKTSGCISYSKNLGRKVYIKSPDQWWPDYNGIDDIVLDDFYGWLPFHFLLRLLDKYQFIVNTKGSHASVNSATIHITSNKLPREWYTEETRAKYDFTALYKRINAITIWKSRGEEPEVISTQADLDLFFDII